IVRSHRMCVVMYVPVAQTLTTDRRFLLQNCWNPFKPNLIKPKRRKQNEAQTIQSNLDCADRVRYAGRDLACRGLCVHLPRLPKYSLLAQLETQMKLRTNGWSIVAALALSLGGTYGLFMAPVAAQSAQAPVIYLNQAWSQEDREWYYHFSQGTCATVKYETFLNLEVADSQ